MQVDAWCCSGARRGERLSGQTANGSSATVAAILRKKASS